MRRQRNIILSGLLVLSLLVFPMGTASAQECSLETSEIDSLVETYNENVDQAPAIARGQLADERIDLRVATEDEERRFTITTASNGSITHWEEAPADEPTIRVETDESTACEIITADDPAAEFTGAIDDGSIEMTGVGIKNKIKVGAVESGVKIATSLSGFF